MSEEILKRETLEKIFDQLDLLTAPPERVFFNTKQLCEFLGLSKKTIQKYRDQNLLGYSQLGSVILYRLSDVIKMFEKHFIKPR